MCNIYVIYSSSHSQSSGKKSLDPTPSPSYKHRCFVISCLCWRVDRWANGLYRVLYICSQVWRIPSLKASQTSRLLSPSSELTLSPQQHKTVNEEKIWNLQGDTVQLCVQFVESTAAGRVQRDLIQGRPMDIIVSSAAYLHSIFVLQLTKRK